MRIAATSARYSTVVFFFQAEDGIRDYKVTGVQTCALPISLNRLGAKEEFAVPDPMKAPRARRTGVTYYTMLHHLAAKPASATVRSITEEGGRIRLTLAFDPAVDGECGNGVEKGYYGYFGVGGDTGYLVLDANRFVPVEAGMGKLTETFAEVAQGDRKSRV